MKRAVRLSLLLPLASLFLAGCGAQTVHLDGTTADGGSPNPNSSPDAIAPGVSIVIEDQETAMKIAVDEKRVYWLSRLPTYVPARHFARVRSCEKNDCAATIVTYEEVATDMNPKSDFAELAAGGDRVYWVHWTEGAADSSVLSCPSAGCTGSPQMFAASGDPMTMAVDETHLYWVSHKDGILRRPLSGAGSPQAIVNEVPSGPLRVDATHVYWISNWSTSNAAVKRVAKEGNEPPVTLVMDQNQASSLALDAEFFYWTNSYSVGTVSRCPLSGCVGAPTVIIAGQPYPTTIVTDGKSLFWTNFAPTLRDVQRGVVMRCPIETCSSALETLAVQMFAQTGLSMAVDRSDVYWVAQGADGDPVSGYFPRATIYRHPR